MNFRIAAMVLGLRAAGMRSVFLRATSSNVCASIDSRMRASASSDPVHMRPETAAFFTVTLLSSAAKAAISPSTR